MKVLARAMRSRGLRCLWFIDDALIVVPSHAQALAAHDLVKELFRRICLTRATDKGVWVPTQCLPHHLGFSICTTGPHGRLSVPERRCRNIAASAKDLPCRAARNARKVPTDLLRSFKESSARCH